MELFNYIAIAFSFVYSTAAIRLIGGLSAAINKNSRYVVHLLFIVIMLISGYNGQTGSSSYLGKFPNIDDRLMLLVIR